MQEEPKSAPADESPSPSPTSSAERLDWELNQLEVVNTTTPVQGITIWAQQLDHSGKALEHDVTFEHGRRCLPGPSENECAKRRRVSSQTYNVGRMRACTRS